MNFANYLGRTARRYPWLPATASGTVVMETYSSLAGRVSRLAGSILKRAQFGDRVALVSSNTPEYLEALLAIWHAGMVAVPINAKLHVDEVAYILDHCQARLVFGQPGAPIPLRFGWVALGGTEYHLMTKGPGLAAKLLSDETPAWIFYTSGTTGRPKGATLTHGNLIAMCVAFLTDVTAVAPGDAMIHATQLSHGTGLYALPHILAGGLNVTLPGGKFDPDETERLMRRWPGSCTFGPPTVLNRLVQVIDPDVWVASGNPKALIFGGSPLYIEDAKKAHAATGGRIAQIYGQGESPCTITAISRAMYAALPEEHWGTVGVEQFGVTVRIGDVANDDRELPAGADGEILVSGPQVMAGYWEAPGVNAQALRNGWLHTGDVGTMDAGGFLTLKDRSKDVIISGGFNVYPREVEEVLLRHPNVAEVSVVGQKNQAWGEEIVAFVVQRTPPLSGLGAALDALCLGHIARFKRPRRYVMVDALPKNQNGKVLKRELAALR